MNTKRAVVARTPGGLTVVAGPVGKDETLNEMRARVAELGWTVVDTAVYYSWGQLKGTAPNGPEPGLPRPGVDDVSTGGLL